MEIKGTPGIPITSLPKLAFAGLVYSSCKLLESIGFSYVNTLQSMLARSIDLDLTATFLAFYFLSKRDLEKNS